jgi:hypothetical protein
MYTNTLSLRNKLTELIDRIRFRKPKIICLTETWLNDTISDQEVAIPGYSIVRNDRHLTKGGGVAAYVEDSVKYSTIASEVIQAPAESLWLNIHGPKETRLVIGIAYRTPSAPESWISNLSTALEHSSRNITSRLLLVGDFNLPDVDVSSGQATSADGVAFVNIAQQHGLTEHVQQNTRYRHGQNPSRLDLILTNEHHMIDVTEINAPLGASDHVVIDFRIIHDVTITKPAHTSRRNFRRANFSTVRDSLRKVDWTSVPPNISIEDHWSFVSGAIEAVIDQHVPLLHSKKVPRRSCLLSNTLRLIKEKKILWNRYQLMGDASSRIDYQRVRNDCTNAVRSDQRYHKELLAKRFIESPKSFYSYIASLSKSRAAITSIQGLHGLSSSNGEAANTLQHQYASVFGHRDESINASITNASDPLDPIDNLCLFYPAQVELKLNHLKEDKSPGLDGIPPVFLKKCAAVLAKPLAALFHHSFTAGQLPLDWKRGVISPIYKGGDRTLPSNYRPVALLSTISKVMESIIDDHMRQILAVNNSLACVQHGFRKAHSCTTNLLAAMDAWTEAVDASLPVDIIYLDFSKAFDRVDHTILGQKLENHGFHSTLLAWLKQYLYNRSYQVRVNGVLSNAFPAPTGVPQGSILGPLLFLVFVNDIPSVCNSPVLLYADDTKIWQTMRNPEDPNKLQLDLDALVAWSTDNNLPFNHAKSKVMHLRHMVPNQYKIGMTTLPAVLKERDLGTIITSDLSLTTNTQLMVNKANRKLALLSRVLGRFPLNCAAKLFCTLVRPLLETNIQACSPYLQRDIASIESVQRRATKRVQGLTDKSYGERLVSLQLFPLNYRRTRGDLIMVYNILNTINHPNRELLTLAHTTHLRGHSFKLETQRARLQCRHYSFSVRICALWNKLPARAVLASNLDIFKRELDTWLLPRWQLPN